MRLKMSNLTENLLGRVIFASFYTLVTLPWFNYLFKTLAGVDVNNRFGWFAFVVVLGGVILLISYRIEKAFLAKIFLLLVFILTARTLVPIILGNLEPEIDRTAAAVIGFCSMIFYLLMGLRYQETVSGRRDFMNEFGVMTGVMLFNLLLNKKLDFGIGYQHILYFFITGIVFATYRKFREVQTSAEKRRRSWFIATASVVFFVSIFAIMLTFGFTKESIELLLTPINLIFYYVRELFIMVLYYVAMAVSPIIEFFIKLLMPEERRQIDFMENLNNSTQELRQLAEGHVTTNGSDWIGKVLLVLIVLVILAYVIMRLSRSKERNSGYEEIRESIFNLEEVKKDFFGMFQSLADRFRRKSGEDESIYDGSSYAIRIREMYYRFLKALHPRIPFMSFFTPREYMANVEKQSPVEAGQVLTNIYEQARYSQSVSADDVARMEEAFKKAVPENNTERKKK